MEEKRTSYGRTILAYVVLIILAFLCLFFFYILIINATRNHSQIQQGTVRYQEQSDCFGGGSSAGNVFLGADGIWAIRV